MWRHIKEEGHIVSNDYHYKSNPRPAGGLPNYYNNKEGGNGAAGGGGGQYGPHGGGW